MTPWASLATSMVLRWISQLLVPFGGELRTPLMPCTPAPQTTRRRVSVTCVNHFVLCPMTRGGISNKTACLAVTVWHHKETNKQKFMTSTSQTKLGGPCVSKCSPKIYAKTRRDVTRKKFVARQQYFSGVQSSSRWNKSCKQWKHSVKKSDAPNTQKRSMRDAVRGLAKKKGGRLKSVHVANRQKPFWRNKHVC